VHTTKFAPAHAPERQLSVCEHASPSLHTVPFTLKNKKIILEGLLNGKKAELVLDTGAERTAISRQMANRTGTRGVAETMITGVGAPGVPNGAVYVFFGQDDFPTTVPASEADLTVTGQDGDTGFGSVLEELKDVNGDLEDDFAVGGTGFMNLFY